MIGGVTRHVTSPIWGPPRKQALKWEISLTGGLHHLPVVGERQHALTLLSFRSLILTDLWRRSNGHYSLPFSSLDWNNNWRNDPCKKLKWKAHISLVYTTALFTNKKKTVKCTLKQLVALKTKQNSLYRRQGFLYKA